MPDLNREFHVDTKEELVAAITESINRTRIGNSLPFASNRRIDPYAYAVVREMIGWWSNMPWDAWLFLAFHFGDTENQRLLNAVFPSFLAETEYSHLHNQ